MAGQRNSTVHPVPSLASSRHPFELFVLFLGVLAGAPLLWGSPAPGSTATLLGSGLVHVWSWILVGGCVTALVGVWWTWWGWLRWYHHRWRPDLGTALLVEQVGMVAVGVAMAIYTTGVLTHGGPGKIVPAGIVGAWSLASWWRAAQIQRWIRTTIHASRIL